MSPIDCYPKVLAVGQTIEICVELPAGLSLADTPSAWLVPLEGIGATGTQELAADSVIYSGECLRMRICLSHEQEYLIRVLPGTAPREKALAEFHVYGLREDLAQLRPLKGDFHMHSSRSDGKELPEQVAVACRRIGLDFMALTDHGQYEPSLEAARPFEGLAVGLAIFPGEEVHPPNNPVHMINFGGRASVNDLFKAPSYALEVDAIAAELAPFQSEGRRHAYASCLWCYQKIRELGGLGIFCHPYWITHASFNVCEELIARHFQEHPFDAYEVFGGFDKNLFEANTLQAARYHEERTRDANLPIVGSSDAHGCDTSSLFGWYYTIVFAESTRLPDICGAVRQLRAVAVAVLPGQPPQVVGPFRLVKLALFLMREYMPSHDALCAEEAGIMQRHLVGAKDSVEQIAALHEKIDAHHEQLWRR